MFSIGLSLYVSGVSDVSDVSGVGVWVTESQETAIPILFDKHKRKGNDVEGERRRRGSKKIQPNEIM